MRFKVQLQVLGMKASKGQMDNGTEYDSTKVYCVTDMDKSKGNAIGFASAEYTLGKASEFEKYKHLPFPVVAECELEIVTNGKTMKTVMHSCVPVEQGKKAA